MGSTTTLGGIGGTGIGNGSKNPLSSVFGNPANDVLLGLGGIGGAFPQVGTTSGTATSSSSGTNAGWQNNYSASDVNSLLSTLSSLLGTSSTTTSGTAGTTPTLSPESAKFMNQLIGKYSNLAGQGTNLAPYQAQQTQQINRNSDLQSQAVNNIMAARGLSTSPASGTAQANIQAGRVGQINNLAESIPLLQQQLQRENLGAAGGFFSQLPRGSVTQNAQTQLGTTSQQGSTTQQGATTGVNTSDTNFQTNSANQGTTTQQAKSSQGGGIGGIFGAITPILAALIP